MVPDHDVRVVHVLSSNHTPIHPHTHTHTAPALCRPDYGPHRTPATRTQTDTMDFDLEALSASVRLQLNYDRVELGQKTWDAPVPLALCVGSVVVYIAVFLLSHVTPIPSESGLERLKKVGLPGTESVPPRRRCIFCARVPRLHDP
jgi:hypothetical protein